MNANDSRRGWNRPASHFIADAPESEGRSARSGACLNQSFRGRPYGKLLIYVCVGAIVFVAGAEIASAVQIDLTSGTSGSLTAVPQSYNETRAVDITVLSGVDLLVESMTIVGFDGSGVATSAVLGARIYETGTQSLVASAEITVSSAGPATVPISATLVSGGEYRVGFFAVSTPPENGQAILFYPDLPYTEAAGLLRINGAYAISDDSFPLYSNIFVPQVSLVAVPVPEPGSAGLLCMGALGVLGFRWRSMKSIATRLGPCRTS